MRDPVAGVRAAAVGRVAVDRQDRALFDRHRRRVPEFGIAIERRDARRLAELPHVHVACYCHGGVDGGVADDVELRDVGHRDAPHTVEYRGLAVRFG